MPTSTSRWRWTTSAAGWGRVEIPTTTAGFNQLVDWASHFGVSLLLTPHSNRDEVALVRWPTLEPVAALTPEDCQVDGAFELYACHVADDAILIMTIEGTIILTDGSLVPRGLIELAGHPGELVSMYALGPQQFATVSYTSGSNVTVVWQLDVR